MSLEIALPKAAERKLNYLHKSGDLGKMEEHAQWVFALAYLMQGKYKSTRVILKRIGAAKRHLYNKEAQRMLECLPQK